jgi:hypothetical protein
MDGWINDWCDPVGPGDERGTDIQWRGRHYRPGPIGEPRILGLRPSAGTFGVWSESLWRLVLRPEPDIPHDALPQIGCDVANYGTDYTVFHVRCGPVSLYHQSVNGWEHDRIFERLVSLAREYAEWLTRRQDRNAAPIDPRAITIKIDDDATGRAVLTLLSRERFRGVAVNAATKPSRPDLYPNVRSELWFQTPRKAATGLVNISRLDREARQRLEMQALAPEWQPDRAGRRQVESKDELRAADRLGRSPDDMDAMNLAYYEHGGGEVASAVDVTPRDPRPAGQSAAQRRGMFGG